LRVPTDEAETITDVISAAPVAALAATLDLDLTPLIGDALPELWHWLFFHTVARQSAIGVDGHPRKGTFLPDLGLPRRMWASGRLTFHEPIKVGESATRMSRVLNVQTKDGRSGRLAFVTVKHEITTARGLVLEEEQDIVYRDAPGPNTPVPTPTAPPDSHEWQRVIHPTEVLLFRYSALTFNAHRIHYDKQYATAEEGYPGLVVHGPLLATLLLDLLRRNIPEARVQKYCFKAIRPTFLGNEFVVCGRRSEDGKQVELFAEDHDGWLTMTAQAILA
jgi:3-methylfumaryl-CoA hydratase